MGVAGGHREKDSGHWQGEELPSKGDFVLTTLVSLLVPLKTMRNKAQKNQLLPGALQVEQESWDRKGRDLAPEECYLVLQVWVHSTLWKEMSSLIRPGFGT